jgi:hypothetical protein
MSEYRIELLNDDNFGDLIPIYHNAVGNDIDVETLRKKFNTQYTGFKNVGFIAYSPQNEPAAFYGVLPCWMEYEGKRILVAQSGNTMTHTKHRRKNLFVILAEATYNYCKQIGVEMVFGFPNEFSYPGFVKKLNWTHQENIQAYITKTLCIPLIRLTSIFKISPQKHIAWANFVFNFLPKGNSPFKSLQQQGCVNKMDRSKEFFDYKTYHTKHLAKINNKNVWFKCNNMFVLIGDIEECSDAEFYAIVKKLHRLCFWAGIPHLRFHISPNSHLEKLLQSIATKYDKSYPIGYVNLGTIDINMKTIKFTLADNDTF